MLLTALATLGSIGATAYSKYRQAQLNNAAQQTATNAYNDRDRILQSRLRAQVTDRTEYQDILTRQKALLDAQWKRVQGANAVAGSSGGLEAGAAQKQANALAIADTQAKAASQASAKKDAIQDQIMANNANYAQQQIANLNRQAADVSGAASQAYGAMGGIIRADNPTYDASILRMFGLAKQA